MMYWIEADVYIILYYIIYKSITVTLISSWCRVDCKQRHTLGHIEGCKDTVRARERENAKKMKTQKKNTCFAFSLRLTSLSWCLFFTIRVIYWRFHGFMYAININITQTWHHFYISSLSPSSMLHCLFFPSSCRTNVAQATAIERVFNSFVEATAVFIPFKCFHFGSLTKTKIPDSEKKRERQWVDKNVSWKCSKVKLIDPK